MQLDHSHHTRVDRAHPVVLVLDSVSDPLNVGSLFRLADALGVARLYLCGRTPAPPHPSLRKTSRGTESLVPYSVVPETLAALRELTELGYTPVVLEITSTSTSIYSFSVPAGKIALVVGAEESGVSDAVLEAVETHVHIDLDGVQSSMNVAMAAAIGIYEIVRQMKL